MAREENSLSDKVRKRMVLKEQELERKQRMLIKDRSSNVKVMEEVFDRSTLITIYSFIKKGEISEINGVVKAGKEARIYWGKAPDGTDIAIKIYLTSSAAFKRGRLQYIIGDYRFRNLRKNTRSLVFAWAQKEFRNLRIAYDAKIKVPEPIAVKKNVLLMDFIGKDGVSAPIMKESDLAKPDRIYGRILTYVKTLFNKARLIHSDLSEYNVMIWENEPVIFDLSQAVSIDHPSAIRFLMRDLQNLNRFFKKKDVDIITTTKLFKRITGKDITRL